MFHRLVLGIGIAVMEMIAPEVVHLHAQAGSIGSGQNNKTQYNFYCYYAVAVLLISHTPRIVPE